MKRVLAFLVAVFVPSAAFAQASADSVPAGISAAVFRHALAAHKEATTEGKTNSLTLTIIDYTRAATEKRLWVVDVLTRQILESEYVAHGEGSGDLFPTHFSNRDGTHQSSLGTFITGPPFEGVRGHSLRLFGLEPGINDNAFARGLVIHGTPGVSEAKARRGEQGRTEGCPAVPEASAKHLIARIAYGSVVFVWYPDAEFLERSTFLEPGAGNPGIRGTGEPGSRGAGEPGIRGTGNPGNRESGEPGIRESGDQGPA